MKEPLSSVSPKGQVTIPAHIRRLLGLKARDKVAFKVEGGKIEILRVGSPLDSIYRSVPRLKRRLSDREMTDIAAEEHAEHVVNEGRD